MLSFANKSRVERSYKPPGLLQIQGWSPVAPLILELFTQEMKMKKILFLLVILCTGIFVMLVHGDDSRKEIQAMLDQQMQGWNEHNIEKYMNGYWNSEQLTYQSGNKRMRGWQTLLEMYQTKYAGENMGILDFSDIEITMLSSDSAYVLGRWKVTLRGTAREGVFTLIVRRMKNGWHIVHDHSS
jgi:beta-aspartyl-peptidase (threonine type)